MKYQGNIKYYERATLDSITFSDARVLKFIQDFSTYYPKNSKKFQELLNKYKPTFEFFADKDNVIEIRKIYFEILENLIKKIRDRGIIVLGSLSKSDDFEIDGGYNIIIGDIFDYNNDFLNEYLEIYNNALVQVSPIDCIIKTLEKRGKSFEHIRELETRLSKLQNENKNILKTLKCKKIANQITELKEYEIREFEYLTIFKIDELELINDFFNCLKEYDKFEIDYRNCTSPQKQTELNYADNRIMIYSIKEMIDNNITTLDEVEYVFSKYSLKKFKQISHIYFCSDYYSYISQNIFRSIEWISKRNFPFSTIRKLINEGHELEKPYFEYVDIDKYNKLKERDNYEYTKHR